MARFHQIKGNYINAELVRLIQDAGDPDTPASGCFIYFTGTDKALFLEGYSATKAAIILGGD